MPVVKFPKKRDDGSFAVSARFKTSDASLVILIRDYVKEWGKANDTRTRIWRSNKIEVERSRLLDEFALPPFVAGESSSVLFAISFEVRPGSTRWKDWAVSLVGDLTKMFPEVTFEGFSSDA